MTSPCFSCNDTGKGRQGWPCSYCTFGDATIPAEVLDQDTKVTSVVFGYEHTHETIALHDETYEAVRVDMGEADTFFSRPAEAELADGSTEYGFVTSNETTTGQRYFLFHKMANQDEAHEAYEESIAS
jgi:hypothetical protein